MSFTAVVQGGSNSDGSGTTFSVTVAGVHVGDHVVCSFSFEGAVTTATCSDGTSSLTAAAFGVTSGSRNAEPWLGGFYLQASVASGSVTYTITLGAARTFKQIEVHVNTPSGAVTLDGTAVAAAGSTTPISSGNITTTGTDNITFGHYAEYGQATVTETINGNAEEQLQRANAGASRNSALFARRQTAGFTGPAAGTLGGNELWTLGVQGFKISGGASTITGSGTPAAGSATTAGTAERSVTSSGTPTAQSATTAGTAERSVKGTGTPAAQAATTAGTAERSITGTGAPAATSATTAGTAERSVKGTGAPAAQSSTTAGTAERVITSSGAPAAQSATTAGTGQVGNVITGSGTPAAQSATVAGTAERVITGTGAAVAQASTAAGTAERTVKGTGTPAAQSATVVGIGSGVIVATVSGLILLSAAADPFVARDDAGRVLPNATLDFYLTGTTEPADSLPDGAHYVADVDGEFQIIELEAAVAYRVIHKTAEGTLRFDVDPYVCNCGELEPLFRSPVNRAFLANDRIASAATLTFDGTLYADGELSVPHPNPLTANAAGIFRPIYFDESETYNITLKDAAGNVLDEFAPYVCECAADVVTGSGAPAAQAATTAGTGSVTAPSGTLRLTNHTITTTTPGEIVAWGFGQSAVGIGGTTRYINGGQTPIADEYFIGWPPVGPNVDQLTEIRWSWVSGDVPAGSISAPVGLGPFVPLPQNTWSFSQWAEAQKIADFDFLPFVGHNSIGTAVINIQIRYIDLSETVSANMTLTKTA